MATPRQDERRRRDERRAREGRRDRQGPPVRTIAFWAGVVLLASAPAALVWSALSSDGDGAARQTLAQCAEPKSLRASAGGGTGIELLANRARPTLAIALADRRSASDTITFSTKSRRLVPPEAQARTSAVLLETPRRSAAEPFDGVVDVKATPWVGGTIVRLTVCVDRGGVLKAGTFQGTARVYGPRVEDFDYALIVTEKWPWQVAVAILWYAGLAFVLVAWRTGSLAFGMRDAQGKQFIPVTAGIAVGLAAMVPTFFGAYWNNSTWGSDPGTHVAGLATAGLTAAMAGLAAARRILAPRNGGDSGDDEPQPARRELPPGNPVER